MKTHPLNVLDASWLYVEAPETPMHVAGLLPFALPDDAPPDYFHRLMAQFREAREFYPPWNQRLRSPRLKSIRHVWVEEDELDLDYHVRHSALPRPGGERELGQLIARLHSHPLDFTRPPWELHLIEGLQGNRFALYIKVHHSLIDGVSGVKLLLRSMSPDREASLAMPPFWAARPPEHERADDQAHTPVSALDGLIGAVRGQIGSVPDLVRAFAELLKAARHKSDTLAVPFDTPMSILNGRIRGQRRVATQQFPLARLKALAAAARCTLNDIVLAVCGGALRRFLDEEGGLPEKPLTAGIPMSFRPTDDEGTGNAITFLLATLGTDIADARERLAAIHASVNRAKEHIQALPREAMQQYTMLLMAPNIVQLLTGLGGRTRSVFNITISNVPGPTRPLYFRGARLEATYPISLITHGQALNITCQSYADTLNFGFVGCRDTIPHLQRLAVYSAEAVEELERAFAKPAKAKRAPRQKTRAAAPEETTPATRAPRKKVRTETASPEPPKARRAPRQKTRAPATEAP